MHEQRQKPGSYSRGGANLPPAAVTVISRASLSQRSRPLDVMHMPAAQSESDSAILAARLVQAKWLYNSAFMVIKQSTYREKRFDGKSDSLQPKLKL